MRLICTIVLLLALAPPAHAVLPDEILKDPALEARARHISSGLRCMVCQNQSIDDSEAPIARDLRVLIRQQLGDNKADSEIVDFIVARYGEYVLLKPRFEAATLILWLAPFLILLSAMGFAVIRRKPSKPPPPLSAEEKSALRHILDR